MLDDKQVGSWPLSSQRASNEIDTKQTTYSPRWWLLRVIQMGIRISSWLNLRFLGKDRLWEEVQNCWSSDLTDILPFQGFLPMTLTIISRVFARKIRVRSTATILLHATAVFFKAIAGNEQADCCQANCQNSQFFT